jgi:hypothetical protein
MPRRRIVVGLVVAALGVTALGGEIQELHEQREQRQEAQLLRNEEDDHLHGITEIGLERTPCLGACPVYTVIIKSDGTFRYHGERFVERAGDYTGRVSQNGFTRLARFIRDSGFADLQDEYTHPHTDGSTAYTMMKTGSGMKVVSNYDGSGPSKLWAIEELIDKLMLTAEWDQPATRPAAAKKPAK